MPCWASEIRDGGDEEDTVEGSLGFRFSLVGVVLAELDAGVYQLPHELGHRHGGQA